MRWARLRQLEAWAGRGGRGQRIWSVFKHHRHRHSRGNWGQEGSSWARTGIELLVNWIGLAGQQHPSGAGLIPFLASAAQRQGEKRADRPRCSNACNFNYFSPLAAATSIFRLVSKKRKKATPGRASLCWSVHNRDRDFLVMYLVGLRIGILVRPGLIRAKDGMIDGDGGSAANCRKCSSCWHCAYSQSASLGPGLLD